MGTWSGWFEVAREQVREDIRSDPYLVYILLVTFVLAGFWFWHRVPIFATWDEHDRVLDPLVTYSSVINDPSLGGLREGITWSREPWAGTTYLYVIAVLPVVLVAVLTGQIDAIAGIGIPTGGYSHYETWASTPRWVWTWSLVLIRLTNVLFAVGTVYLTYRLGTRIWDRPTGRIASVLLGLTLGFVKLAKEGGEDVPATFFLLVSLYALVLFLESSDDRQFYQASAAGAVGMVFKLTVAPIVLLIGLAHLLGARSANGSFRDAVWRPRLVLTGAGIGLAVMILGTPTLLVGSVREVTARWFLSGGERVSTAVGPTAPTWWWFLRTYFSGFGIGLFVGAVLGVGGSLYLFGKRLVALPDPRAAAPQLDSVWLLVAYLGAFLLLISTWHDWRVHHLLPTFPVIMLLTAWAFRELGRRRRTVARVGLAMLIVSTSIYTGVGVAGYASMPRDEATDWLRDNAEENATMETYYHGFLENAIPHDMRINPIWTDDESAIDGCPTYIQIGYKELLYLRDIPDDQRGYDVDTNVDARAAYVRALLDGKYNYTIVKEFGERPPNFVPHRAEPGSLRDLLPLGIYPHSDQYGDEQEFAANQYVAILKLDGECNRSREPPW